MEKINGAKGRQDGLYLIGRNKYQLIYGYGEDENGIGWNWRQTFHYKPTHSEIEEIIKKTINSETDEKILSGFIWKEMPIWLSQENQFNYKTAYDLAIQRGDKALPVKFKFGTDENPIYYTFDNIEDLTDFYLSLTLYVTKVLNDGWDEKDWVHENIEIFDC